jgi:hypothetical protein
MSSTHLQYCSVARKALRGGPRTLSCVRFPGKRRGTTADPLLPDTLDELSFYIMPPMVARWLTRARLTVAYADAIAHRVLNCLGGTTSNKPRCKPAAIASARRLAVIRFHCASLRATRKRYRK